MHELLCVPTALPAGPRWPNLAVFEHNLAFLQESLIDADERSGQLRPYVRPVARHFVAGHHGGSHACQAPIFEACSRHIFFSGIA